MALVNPMKFILGEPVTATGFIGGSNGQFIHNCLRI